MKLHVYSLYDMKVETFGRPIAVAHVGQLMRELESAVRSGEDQIGKYPSDFRLFELGEFDDHTGVFTVLALPHLVCEVGSLAVGQVGSGATAAGLAAVA